MLTLCVLTSIESLQVSPDFSDCKIVYVHDGDDLFAIMETICFDFFVSIGTNVEPADSQLNSLPFYIRCRWFSLEKLGTDEHTRFFNNFNNRNTRAVWVSDYTDMEQTKPTSSHIIKPQRFIETMLAQHQNANSFANITCCFDVKLQASSLLIWFLQQTFGPVLHQTQLILKKSFRCYEKIDNNFWEVLPNCALLDEILPTQQKKRPNESCDQKALTATQKSWIQQIVKSNNFNFDMAKAICTQDLDSIHEHCKNNTADEIIGITYTKYRIYYNSLAFAAMFDNLEITTRIMQSVVPILFVSQRLTQKDMYLTTSTRPTDKQIRDLKQAYESMWHKSMFETTQLLKDISCIILSFTDSLIVSVS